VKALRKRWQATLADESGIALVMALAIMIVLGIATVSIADYSISNDASATYSSKTQLAFNLAEGGIANAVGILTNPDNQFRLADTTNPLLPAPGSTPFIYTYENGTVSVWGLLDPIIAGTLKKGRWHVIATSSIPWRHAGTTTTISRTVRVDVPFGWSLQQPLNNDAWHYIYSKKTSGTTLALANCDETLYQNVTVKASMYISGNLCMNTPSSVTGTTGSDPPVSLIVKGWLEMDSNTDIGHSTPLQSGGVEIDTGCSNAWAALWTATGCGKAAGNGGFDIQPTAVKSGPTIAPPVADFVGWYTFASPGPLLPCSLIDTGTPPVFDNNGVQDLVAQGSITSVVDLTPTTANYDCKAADGGEIKWVRGNPGKLTINGTIYIDGSVTSSSSPVDFDGQAAIYASGTFLLKNATLCAVLASNNQSCDSSGWLSAAKPDELVIAANGQGTGGSAPYDQVPTGDSVEIKSSNFQGALYGTSNVEVDTTSNAQGPMVANAEIISQHGGSPFPQFSLVPFGTPGNQITKYLAQAPQYYSGG
jgi:hypothetical protein